VTLRARSWLGSGLVAGGLLAAGAGGVLDRTAWVAAGLTALGAGAGILALAVRAAARGFRESHGAAEEALRREIARMQEESKADGGQKNGSFEEGKR
jgi:hypothetical protein